MGTYTELHCKMKLKKDTPEPIISFLKRILIDGDLGISEDKLITVSDVPRPELDGSFFDCTRWHMLLLANNFDKGKGGGYFYEENGYWTIELDTEFKNYNNEVELFIEWISQYVVGRKQKEYVGWCQNEMHDDRDNLYIHRS